MMVSAGTPIRLALVTKAVPPAVHDGMATEFGVQDKQRRLHPGSPHADGSQRFEFEVIAEQATGGLARFSGQFVHGTPAERFLYLGWRPVDGTIDGWIRRWKIPLSDLAGQIDGAIRPGDRFVGEVDRSGAEQVWLRKIEWKRIEPGRMSEQPAMGLEEH